MLGILNLMCLTILIIIGISILGSPEQGGAGEHFQTSSISNFSQTINPGTLSIGIVDEDFAPVSTPTVAMDPVTFSFDCQETNGTFGSSSQKIYVKNPDSADGGWSASIAAADPTAVWDSAGTDFDFNDPSTSGCSDGDDTDSLAGQMTINPDAGTLSTGACLNCSASNVTKGTQASFEEGVVDAITIMSGTADSDDIGDWALTGVDISQSIPPEQPAASDYDLDLVLTITAT